MKSGRGRRRSRIRRPKLRGRIGSRSPSMSFGRGRRSTSMSSGRGRRSPSRTTFHRGGFRQRPTWRARGRYPRRYRTRPMSSGSCVFCFIILAVIILINFLPSFIFVLAPEFSSTVLIGAVAFFFIIALCFITQAVIDDDDDEKPQSSDDGTTKIIERERVLVVCPYCGTKNDQGRSKCENCDGDL